MTNICSARTSNGIKRYDRNLSYRPDDEATHKMPVDVLGEGESNASESLPKLSTSLTMSFKNESLRNEI